METISPMKREAFRSLLGIAVLGASLASAAHADAVTSLQARAESRSQAITCEHPVERMHIIRAGTAQVTYKMMSCEDSPTEVTRERSLPSPAESTLPATSLDKLKESSGN